MKAEKTTLFSRKGFFRWLCQGNWRKSFSWLERKPPLPALDELAEIGLGQPVPLGDGNRADHGSSSVCMIQDCQMKNMGGYHEPEYSSFPPPASPGRRHRHPRFEPAQFTRSARIVQLLPIVHRK